MKEDYDLGYDDGYRQAESGLPYCLEIQADMTIGYARGYSDGYEAYEKPWSVARFQRDLASVLTEVQPWNAKEKP